MTIDRPTDDHGLSAHIEALEAMTAPGDAENQQLICLLLELKRRRSNETEASEMLRRLSVILSGSDAPGEIKVLTVTAQSYVDRCKALAKAQGKDAPVLTAGVDVMSRGRFETEIVGWEPLLDAELQEYRKTTAKPFMYGISDADGEPYVEELCVSDDASYLATEVDALNEECGEQFYRVVALYTTPGIPPSYAKTEDFTEYHEGWNACQAYMLRATERPLADAERKELQEYRKAPMMIFDASTGEVSPIVPDGYALVPIEPTERMVINGFESEPDKNFSSQEDWEAYQAMSGCQQAAYKTRLCWAAMLATALQTEGDANGDADNESPIA